MHNAAWTAVDKAEQMPDLVYKVNARGIFYSPTSPTYITHPNSLFVRSPTKFNIKYINKKNMPPCTKTLLPSVIYVKKQIKHFNIMTNKEIVRNELNELRDNLDRAQDALNRMDDYAEGCMPQITELKRLLDKVECKAVEMYNNYAINH